MGYGPRVDPRWRRQVLETIGSHVVLERGSRARSWGPSWAKHASIPNVAKRNQIRLLTDLRTCHRSITQGSLCLRFKLDEWTSGLSNGLIPRVTRIKGAKQGDAEEG
jgi:hypothetical protein